MDKEKEYGSMYASEPSTEYAKSLSDKEVEKAKAEMLEGMSFLAMKAHHDEDAALTESDADLVKDLVNTYVFPVVFEKKEEE